MPSEPVGPVGDVSVSSAPLSASGRASGASPSAPVREQRRLVKRPWIAALLVVPLGLAYVVVTSAAVIAVAFVLILNRRGEDASALAARAGFDADFVSIGAWAGTAVVVPLILVVARRQAVTNRAELLGWKMPTARQLGAWLGGLLLFLAASDGLTLLLGREIVPQVMRDLYTSADAVVVFWLTLVVAAPLFEELLFRGLLFQALIETRLKFVGAALITSLGWSLLHVQYDGYGIASIFAGGLLLAAARYYTGSVLVCIAMHAAMNLLATFEVLWVLRNGAAPA